MPPHALLKYPAAPYPIAGRIKYRCFILAWAMILLPWQALSCTTPVYKETIYQEFRYHQPAAGEVFLVWGFDNWKQWPADQLPADTRLVGGSMHTPMLLEQDTFRLRVPVPPHATIEFVFWVTRSASGQIADEWDTNGRSGQWYEVQAARSNPVLISGEKLGVNRRIEVNLLDYAWLLGSVALLVSVFWWYLKRRFQLNRTTGKIHEIIAFAIFLYGSHLAIRYTLAGISSYESSGIRQWLWILLASGSGDLKYITAVTSLLVILLFLVRKPIYRNGIIGAYYVWALVSLLAALSNLLVVHYLETPLNYRWLYYADFLKGTDASMALNEGAGGLLVWRILVSGISLIILSILLARIFSPQGTPLLVRFLPSLAGLALIAAGYQAHRQHGHKFGWEQVTNPVVHFVKSCREAISEPTLFSLSPDDGQMPEITPKSNPGTQKSRSSSEFRNVVILVLESAAAGYVDMYGGPYALFPNLRQLQQHALVFDNIYTHAPSTNKSMLAILCSIYPWISFKSVTQEFPDLAIPDLGSVLQQEGYRTAVFASSDLRFQNGIEFLCHRGFDLIEDMNAMACQEEFFLDPGNTDHLNGINDLCMLDHFRTWLDSNSEEPLMAVLWTYQAHYPYFISGPEIKYTVEDLKFNRYLNALRHYDVVAGELYRIITECGLAKNTLFIVVGDHGEAFGQHGQYGHASNLYEENVHVPLIFIHPTLFAGERNTTPGGLIDIAPTITNLLGIGIPDEWQGSDLMDSDAGSPVFFFSPWSNFLFGYREDSLKYIFNETKKSIEIYNLITDPSEWENLAPARQDLVPPARLKMARWIHDNKLFMQSLQNP
jgi:lipoteichoic acid synthase